MTEISPLLALPYLMPAQAQKHVTHNAALQILDALVQLRLVALDATTPPETPAPGAAYALGATPADAWAGQGGQLAIWQDPQWLFLTPRAGWRAWVAGAQGQDGALHVWDGTAWILPPPQATDWSSSAWPPMPMPPTVWPWQATPACSATPVRAIS